MIFRYLWTKFSIVLEGLLRSQSSESSCSWHINYPRGFMVRSWKGLAGLGLFPMVPKNVSRLLESLSNPLGQCQAQSTYRTPLSVDMSAYWSFCHRGPLISADSENSEPSLQISKKTNYIVSALHLPCIYCNTSNSFFDQVQPPISNNLRARSACVARYLKTYKLTSFANKSWKLAIHSSHFKIRNIGKLMGVAWVTY